MDLAVAILQVVASIATVAALTLALVTVRDARLGREEEQGWRREERREGWLDQLQRVAGLVEQIIDTVPFRRTADRDIYQRELKIALQRLNWTPIPHTRELAALRVGQDLGEKFEEVGKEARAELEAVFTRTFGPFAPR
jgi:hypothetical protein